MRRIAIINQKGGVGKTTTSVNLGAALARAGKRVCILDLDPQAHATTHLGIEPDGESPSMYDVLIDSRPLAEVRIRVAGLQWPKQLVTSADVQRFKPDPDPYLKGAELLKFAPADCLVVEDAPAGIRAGKAAGASVLALRTTDIDPQLSAAGADWIVNDLASVQLDPPANNHHLAFSLTVGHSKL